MFLDERDTQPYILIFLKQHNSQAAACPPCCRNPLSYPYPCCLLHFVWGALSSTGQPSGPCSLGPEAIVILLVSLSLPFSLFPLPHDLSPGKPHASSPQLLTAPTFICRSELTGGRVPQVRCRHTVDSEGQKSQGTRVLNLTFQHHVNRVWRFALKFPALGG